ncbi:uncharacterized protein BJX67DRAFT_78155 [Aspergillus lucknowensis]|uniref:Uncharacterized protein n=1 Tax=Aspergillus lucknowensis TaxID=176173 RepID=A0ABR4L6M6_9EURO
MRRFQFLVPKSDKAESRANSRRGRTCAPGAPWRSLRKSLCFEIHLCFPSRI